MKTYIKTILRDTFRRALAGFILSLAVPYAAHAMDMYALIAKTPVVNPLWMAFFFGAFGLVNAALSPAFERIFSAQPAKAPAAEPAFAASDKILYFRTRSA